MVLFEFSGNLGTLVLIGQNIAVHVWWCSSFHMMESIGYVQQGDGVDFECNGKNSGLDGVAFEPQKCDYSICGILNFLQSEWTKMSIERSRWEFERAELQVSRTISN